MHKNGKTTCNLFLHVLLANIFFSSFRSICKQISENAFFLLFLHLSSSIHINWWYSPAHDACLSGINHLSRYSNGHYFASTKRQKESNSLTLFYNISNYLSNQQFHFLRCHLRMSQNQAIMCKMIVPLIVVIFLPQLLKWTNYFAITQKMHQQKIISHNGYLYFLSKKVFNTHFKRAFYPSTPTPHPPGSS